MIRVHGNDNTPIIHVNSDPVRNVNVTVNSGTSAQRSIGTQTIYGPAGQDGEDGFSPLATVEKVDDVTTITITDINGTTTAEVYDGSPGIEDVQVNGDSVVSDYVANIELKTINNNSIVGSGDLEIIAGVSDVQVDGTSVVTSGVAEITMPSIPPAQVNSDWNAISGVAEILNKPSIPTVNNATLTLTQGGVTKGTFTANASSDTTIDLDAGGGAVTDVQVNSTSVVTAGVANIDLTGYVDTDASNLTSTGQKVFDGQWVDSTTQLANGVSAPKTTATSFSLVSYLPDDNYNYEVICTTEVTTGSTSGNFTKIALSSDLLTYNQYVCQAQTRSSSTVGGFGCCILPIGTNRSIRVGNYSSNTGTYSLWLRGYRRLGTNS